MPEPSTETISVSPTSDGFVSISVLGPNGKISRRGSPSSLSPAASPTVSLECPPGLSYLEFVKQWSDLHVSRWLHDAKVGQHSPRFREHDIRGDVILDLDQTALKETGILSVGDRNQDHNGRQGFAPEMCAYSRPSSIRTIPYVPIESTGTRE